MGGNLSALSKFWLCLPGALCPGCPVWPGRTGVGVTLLSQLCLSLARRLAGPELREKTLPHLTPHSSPAWPAAGSEAAPLWPGRAVLLIAALRLLVLTRTVPVVSALPALPDSGPASPPTGLGTLGPGRPLSPGTAGLRLALLSLLCWPRAGQLIPEQAGETHSEVLAVTSSLSGSLPPPALSAALTPGLPLAPVRTDPVAAALRLLPLSRAQPARLSPRPVSCRGLALPGPLPHPPATGPATGAPARPARPAAVPRVCRAHPLRLVTVNTRAGTRSLRDIVDRVAPDVGGRAVVADEEVLEISLDRTACKHSVESAGWWWPTISVILLPESPCTGTESSRSRHELCSARPAECSNPLLYCTGTRLWNINSAYSWESLVSAPDSELELKRVIVLVWLSQSSSHHINK